MWTVADVEHRLAAIRADQRAHVLAWEDAVNARDRALAAAEAATAVMARCQQRITDDAGEIDLLLDDLHRLIPDPRTEGD